MRRTTIPALSRQATYRDITAKARRSIKGIKRYWYVPSILWGLFAWVITNRLESMHLDIFFLYQGLPWNKNFIILFLAGLAVFLLIGQQHIALQRWKNEEVSFADFIRLDANSGNIFLFQALCLAILWLLSFLCSTLHIVDMMFAIDTLISIPLLVIIVLALGVVYHYLSYGVVAGHWSLIEVFSKGISSATRQGDKLGLLLAHSSLWLIAFVFLWLNFFFICFGYILFEPLHTINPSLWGIFIVLAVLFIISLIIIMRLYAFFEMVLAGIYLQDAARENPELAEAQA